MRVLEVFGEPIASGGQESFVFNVLRNIDRTDLHMDFFTPYTCSNPHYEALIREYHGKLICGGLPFTPGEKRSAIIQPLCEMLRTEHYDAVHIHSIRMSILAYAGYAAHRCGISNIIVHSHGTVLRDDLKYRLAKIYCSGFFRRFPSQFCACSKDAGISRFPAEIVKNKLQIIHNGVDLDRFAFKPEVRAAYRKKLGLKETVLLIGHVGRLSEEKNHLFDLAILEELKKRSETDVRLLWVGEGDQEKELRQTVRQKGLESEVIFQGAVTDVENYMQAMDVTILPSLFEGLGIVGVEAQAAGLPVLASNRVPEELNLTGGVLFLPIDQPERWADRILSAGRQRFPEYNRILAQKGYSIRDTASQVRKLYFPGR